MSKLSDKEMAVINGVTNLIQLIEKDMKETHYYKFELNKEVISLKTIKIKATKIKTKKSKEVIIMLLGIYDEKKEIFTWYSPNVIDVSIEHISKSLGNKNKLFEVIKNILFTKNIKIDKKQSILLPILVAIFSPKFKLIKFESDIGITMFALVDIEWKSHVTDKDFNNTLSQIELLL